MKPIREEYTRTMLERALLSNVKGLSPEQREKTLEREATELLKAEDREKVRDKVDGIQVKMPINEQQVVDSIAAAYLTSEAHPYK
jgi:hypothetical protein